MWVNLTNRIGLFGLLTTLGQMAFADPNVENTVDFDQAIVKTLESNPVLISFGHQLEAQRGRVLQSAVRPGMELDIEVENVAGTGRFSGVDGFDATISLAWSIERGKRQLRIDTASAGLSLLEAEAEIGQLDAAAVTARLFLASLAYQTEAGLVNEAIALAEETVASVERRVRAGRIASADLARAEVELSRTQLRREDLEHRLKASIRSLAAQWGETVPQFDRVRGNLADLPTLDDFSALLTRVTGSPKLRYFASERRLREAEVRRAAGESKPDWRITAGVRQMQLLDDQALVAGITIPLGAKKRNHGRVATARAEAARTDADRVAARVQIETQLFVLFEELKHSLHRATTLREEILPRAEIILKETLRAYEAGRYSYIELRAAQDDALAARSEGVAALIDAHRNVIEIEALTGAALSAPTR